MTYDITTDADGVGRITHNGLLIGTITCQRDRIERSSFTYEDDLTERMFYEWPSRSYVVRGRSVEYVPDDGETHMGQTIMRASIGCSSDARETTHEPPALIDHAEARRRAQAEA